MGRRPGDLAYAYVGWFLLAFPVVVGVADLIAPALSSGRAPFVAAGAAALPLAAYHWYLGRSVGPLGAVFFWSIVVWIGVGLPVAFAVDWFQLDVDVPLLPVVCAVYAVAAVLAVRPWEAEPTESLA